MRKAINVAALIVFIWLVIDAFHIHEILLGLLLAGVIPGTNIALSPTTHLALIATLAIVAVSELMTKNFRISKFIRQIFSHKISQA